jgi:hypothetical protein
LNTFETKPLNTFIYLEWNYKNPDTLSAAMTSFGQRVKKAWRNIYPLQEPTEEKKKKRK